jgi:muramoyltetrapeptide carboxypeptidase
MAPPRIGIVSLSSPVGPVELERGLARLRAVGLPYVVHPHALARSFVTAGTDEQRARSLLDVAFDDAVDVVWCARGGYGAARLLPLLAAATAGGRTPKPKLLVGYSDVTPLHEFVRAAWGWRTLHAPMVAAAGPPSPTPEQWAAVDALVRGEPARCGYESPCLRWMANAPAADDVGEVIGGNLSLWASLAGTPWQPDARGKILFFEDVGERLYRLDRMVVQLEQSGMLDGARAVVLGDFTDCEDEAHTMAGEDGQTRVPLRPTVSLADGLDEVFGRVARRLGVPLASGLTVGHGPNYWPLRLGEPHRLTADGALVPTT